MPDQVEDLLRFVAVAVFFFLFMPLLLLLQGSFIQFQSLYAKQHKEVSL